MPESNWPPIIEVSVFAVKVQSSLVANQGSALHYVSLLPLETMALFCAVWCESSVRVISVSKCEDAVIRCIIALSLGKDIQAIKHHITLLLPNAVEWSTEMHPRYCA